MPTYAKLKDGRLMIIWSDNTDEETMHGYPAEREHDWDCEWETCVKWNYSDIVRTDTNRSIADKYEPVKFVIPVTVITAIEQFMQYGEETKNKAHKGYYSQGGWPYDILKKFVKNCKSC